MNPLDLVTANLLSPMVLAFVLGFVAVLLGSDLKLPEGLYTSLSIYLLFAIGLKGGVALSKASLPELGGPVFATLLVSILTPLTAYWACRKLGHLSRLDSSSMAAHYGSVSAVTFIASLNFAQAQGLKPEGYMPALVAVLELPAILIALGIVLRKEQNRSLGPLIHELLTGRAFILLVGGVLIGCLAGETRVHEVQPLFGDLFKGALTIFLLEMGLVAGSKAGELRQHAKFLLSFGILIPLLNGLIGVFLGTQFGLSSAGAGILGAMAASASYIAAPAAVRMVLPEANSGLALTSAIAVTFPFNLIIGVPLFLELSRALHR